MNEQSAPSLEQTHGSHDPGVQPEAVALVCPVIDSPPGDGTAICLPNNRVLAFGRVAIGFVPATSAWIVDAAGAKIGPFAVLPNGPNAPPQVPAGEDWYIICPCPPGQSTFFARTQNGGQPCTVGAKFSCAPAHGGG
jgi:hypothetical protein